MLKFYKVSFCAYCKGLFCHLKMQSLSYILLYVHKTTPKLRNEKEQ